MSAISHSELTKREKEVVLELLDGGRVATIAELFGVSPRTVSNHLKSSFQKLGVHSQAELIERAYSDPQRLGLKGGVSARTQVALAELEKRCENARDRLIARIDAAYVGPPALDQLGTAAREALPLDSERRRDWRDWLELRGRSDAEAGLMGDPQHGIEEWRDSNIARVSRMQEAGLVRDDIDPGELLAAIGALVLGAGARLLGNFSEAAIEKEMRTIDVFVDSLETTGGT